MLTQCLTRHGDHTCRALLGLNWAHRLNVQRYLVERKLHTTPACVGPVAAAVLVLFQLPTLNGCAAAVKRASQHREATVCRVLLALWHWHRLATAVVRAGYGQFGDDAPDGAVGGGRGIVDHGCATSRARIHPGCTRFTHEGAALGFLHGVFAELPALCTLVVV